MNTFAYVWDIMPTILDLIGTEKWHLYNLANDPGEMRDLAREQPEKLKKLQAAWHRYAMDVGVVLSK
jgi:arylsulfatase A-like enzyme